MYRGLSYSLIILLAMTAIGCSSGNQSITMPQLTPQLAADAAASGGKTNAGQNHNVFWGVWDIHMDPISGFIEVTQLRSAQWTLNVVKLLQPPGGPAGGLTVKFEDTSEFKSKGRLQLTVSLRHPFPGMPQFTGMDVRGVMITSAQKAMNFNSGLTYSDGGVTDPWLANADGYTRWMNPVDFPSDGKIWTYKPGALGMGTGFSATLNPYKYFCNGLASNQSLYGFFSDSGNLHNRGQFLSAAVNTRLYDIYWPMTGPGGSPLLNYQYAVLASWTQPVDLDPGNLPGSFPPDGNTHEAFMLNAVDNSTLYYTPGGAGGNISVELEIFDWQPYLGSGSTVVDEISRIIIESPQGILPNPYEEFDTSYILANSSPGTTPASMIVSLTIPGCTPTAVNGQEIWVGIEQAGHTYSNYGFGTVYPNEPLTAWFKLPLAVSSNPLTPIVISIDPSSGEKDSSLLDVDVTGMNFTGVTQLKLVGDSGEVTASNLMVINDSSIECDFNLAGLPVGLYDVVAIDPVDGQGVLTDGFEIVITDAIVVTSIDPDHGIPNTRIYDVYVTGQKFTNVTELKLVGDSKETSAINLVVIDDQNMVCELDFTGLPIGLYDVVAIDGVNPNGVLVDGFEIMDCPGGISNSLTLYTTTAAYDPLFVAGLFTDGPYSGQIITQAGSSEWSRLDIAVPPADNTPVAYYAPKYSINPLVTDFSWSLDADPVNKVYGYVGFDDDYHEDNWPYNQYDYIKILKQTDGSYVGAVDTNAVYSVAQVDFDEYGNLWAVCASIVSPNWPNFQYTVQRWNYDPSAPAPYYTKAGEWDVSANMSGSNIVISDIVVLQRYRRMYISRSGPSWGVYIDRYDISGTNPVFLDTKMYTAPSFYGTNSYQEVHQRFVDMDVDRTDSVLAGCRIMVMFMGKPGANRTLELRKLNVDLSLINSASLEFNYEYLYQPSGETFQMWFSNFELDDLHGGRVVALYDNFGVPGTGRFGVAPAPVDW